MKLRVWSMRVARIQTVLFSCILTAGFAAPTLAGTAYDGLWNVKIVTKTGTCDPVAQYPMTVTDGKVSAADADVTGSVGSQGYVKVSIRGAYANGHLSGNAGSGKWNGASAGIPCSGRWEASRQ
jgi:type 1 fimbria pilin